MNEEQPQLPIVTARTRVRVTARPRVRIVAQHHTVGHLSSDVASIQSIPKNRPLAAGWVADPAESAPTVLAPSSCKETTVTDQLVNLPGGYVRYVLNSSLDFDFFCSDPRCSVSATGYVYTEREMQSAWGVIEYWRAKQLWV